MDPSAAVLLSPNLGILLNALDVLVLLESSDGILGEGYPAVHVSLAI